MNEYLRILRDEMERTRAFYAAYWEMSYQALAVLVTEIATHGKTLAEKREESAAATRNCRRRERRKKWVPTPGMAVFFDHKRRSYKSEGRR